MAAAAASKKLKVVLLGEGRVGKTSILLRYIKGEWNDKQVSTIQASYLDKKMILEGTNVHLSIWDTAGQERFHALGPIYYRDADGAVLVYDITDETSFQKVKTWVKELRRIVGEDINIIIVGNKIDLQRQRKVKEEEAAAYAKSVGAEHFHTSAKINRGLEDVFVSLTKAMIKRKGKTDKRSGLVSESLDDMDYGLSAGATSGAPRGVTGAGATRRNTRTGQPAINIVDDVQPLNLTGRNARATPGPSVNGAAQSSSSSGPSGTKEKGGCC